MLQTNQNQAALLTAYLNAAHQVLDAADLVCPDPLASTILGSGAESKLARLNDYFSLESLVALRHHVALRTVLREQELAAAINSGVSQLIILAAGFDTFAFRQPEWAKAIKIFEVNDPITHNQKIQHLQAAGISIPANVALLELPQHELQDLLNESECSTKEQTFISWLGETMYQQKDDIIGTLDSLSRFPKGSRLMLDYMLPMDENSRTLLSAISFFNQTKSPTDQYLCHFSAAEVASTLTNFGYDQVKQLYDQSTPLLSSKGAFPGLQSFGLLVARR